MSESRKSRRSTDGNSGLSIRWMGQAGFIIENDRVRLAIDLYLSDYLAKKYAGKEFPHRRMMPPPVRPENLTGIDLYLCTHKHSDHMDPETFPVVMNNNPACKAVIPASLRKHAAGLGISRDRLIPIDAGESANFTELDLRIYAIPSAHEELETDAEGRHIFLGYVISAGVRRIYHSGDCVPYDGLAETLSQSAPDIALLPVNGRDEFKKSRGIPGNFRPDEAIALCRQTGIRKLIPHHFGMFDFNTADMNELKQLVRKNAGAMPEIEIPEPGSKIYW